MRNEIVLIGPVCCGKTSVATILAERLSVQHVQMDTAGNANYRDFPDFDGNVFDKLAAESFLSADRYWEPARAYCVERLLADYRDCIFDLGAGYTCYFDRANHERVARALRPFRHVVLLLPSADARESIDTIRRRCSQARGHDWVHDGADFIEHWVIDDQNARLATRTIFTGNRLPADIAGEVLAGISTADPANSDEPG